MTDTGSFKHDDEKEGASLRLSGGSQDDLSLRVYAGPRSSVHRCGLVGAYTEGELLASLYTTGEFGSRLALSATPADGGDATWLVNAGTGTAGDDRWGFLELRAIDPETREAARIARLDGGGGAHTRGRLIVRDSTRDGVYAQLRVADDGPELYLNGERRSVRITTDGVEVSGDKEGFFDLVAAHPCDPASELHYTVVEGPEVGLYVRGTADLHDGEAVVALPEHFGILASEEELTVQLTPRDRSSRGVAAIELTPHRLRIAELNEGRGSYFVDYQVHGVRRGREGYQVVRPRRAP